MRTNRIKILTELGLSVALFAILLVIGVFKMPYGGNISLAMIPIVVLALRRGPLVGVICGALCGMIDLIFEPYIFHPAQVILDYPIAYAMIGFSGVFATTIKTSLKEGKTLRALPLIVAATVTGACLRLVCHVFSGVIFFSEYAPEAQNVWVYSTVYNASYILPSALAVAIVALLVVPVLHKTLDRADD